MKYDNADEPTVKRSSHAWAIMQGDTPLFHTPGTYPPEYARDAVLEALWRKGQSIARYWTRVHHRDVRARQMADRHYSRRTPGAAEFIPAGHKVVLMHFAPDGTPAALWASHRAAPSANLARPRFDGLDVWDCSIFRIEHKTVPASDLIREAVAITRGVWTELPSDGFYTTVDPRHVAPIKRRGVNIWGYSYIKAGWQAMPLRTKSRNLVQLMLPGDALACVHPIAVHWEMEQQTFFNPALEAILLGARQAQKAA